MGRHAILLLVALVASASASASSKGAQLRSAALRVDEPSDVHAGHSLNFFSNARATVAALAQRIHGGQPTQRDVDRAVRIDATGRRESNPDEAPMNLEELLVVDMQDLGLGVGGIAVLTIIFAVLYNKFRERPMNPQYTADQWKGEWKFDFFGCCAEPKTCLVACCCPAVRWGDTMHMAGVFSSFWAAVGVYFCLHMMSLIMGSLLLFLLAAVGAHYRQGLREKFEIERGTMSTWCCDFWAYCCCAPCAITQEGRMVDEAWAHWHPAIKEHRDRIEKEEA